MLTDPSHCEQKVPCRNGPGFEQCRRHWADAVVVADPAANRRRPRRFCSEHAQAARRNRGYGVLLIRRPEPRYTYRFRLEMGIMIGPAPTEVEARRRLTRLLQPLAGCAQLVESDAEPIALDGEPELTNGGLLAAWERGIVESED